MSRRTFGRGAKLLLLVLSAGVCVAAPAARSDPLAEARSADWIERLDQARDELVDARRALGAAQESILQQRQRHYPRGQAKAELEAQVALARRRLQQAEQALPELLEQARRAGVLPGILRRYEMP